MRKHLNSRAIIALGIIFSFLANIFGPLPIAQAGEFRLPAPGQMVALSPAFDPAVLKGIKLDPQNPFRFHFFVDKGDSRLSQEELKNESAKLIKYFLASLAIPEKDLWVNLSPYEKDRIVPQEFGQTEMGRDLLAEDYILKQITASLVYPESRLGKEFWKKVYAQAEAKYGTTNIPVNTFNKVWIVPEKAVVYENGGVAFVLENHLKVMLEQDYLSLQKHSSSSRYDTHSIGANIVREIVIPALTKEVNEGKNFAPLRQVFYSLILATWYKKKIKDSILNKVYSNRSKIGGINVAAQDKDNIYQEYLRAFKKGVYNYIKEDPDPATGQTIPRKYFSGGVDAALMSAKMARVSSINILFDYFRSWGRRIVDVDVIAGLNRSLGPVNLPVMADMAMNNTADLFPLEFADELKEDQRDGKLKGKLYPIYRLDSHHRVIVKPRPPENVLRARFGYEMANVIGFKGIDKVQIYSRTGIFANIENYWGEGLEDMVGSDISYKLFKALNLINKFDDNAYAELVSTFNSSLVRGDIYRLFSNFHNDSYSDRNMRAIRSSAHHFIIRWVDYDFSFSPSEYFDGYVDSYLRAHADYFIRYGLDLIKAIVGLRDEDIEHIADRVYGGEVQQLLVRGKGISEEEAARNLQGYRTAVVKEVKIRRQQFRNFYDWLITEHKIPDPAQLASGSQDSAMLNRLSMEANVGDINAIIAAFQNNLGYYARLLRWEITQTRKDGKRKYTIDIDRPESNNIRQFARRIDSVLSSKKRANSDINSLFGLLIKYHFPYQSLIVSDMVIDSSTSKDIFGIKWHGIDFWGYSLFRNDELHVPTLDQARKMILQFTDGLKREVGLVNYDIHRPDADALWNKAIAMPEVQSLGEMPHWLDTLGKVLRYRNGRVQKFLINDHQLTREAKETIILKILVSAKQGTPLPNIVSAMFDEWIPQFKRSEEIYGVLGSGGWEAEVHRDEMFISSPSHESFPVHGMSFVYANILGMPIDANVSQDDYIEYVGRPALSWEVQNEKIDALVQLGFLPLKDERGDDIFNDLQYNGIVPETLLSDIKSDQEKIRVSEPERKQPYPKNLGAIGPAPAESEYIDFAKILLFVSEERLSYLRDAHSSLILRSALSVDLPNSRYRLFSGPGAGRLQYPRGDISDFPYSDFREQNHTMQVLHGLMIDYLMQKHHKIPPIGSKDRVLVGSLAKLFETFTKGTDAILEKYGLDRRNLELHYLSNDWGQKVYIGKSGTLERILSLRGTDLEKDMRRHVRSILKKADSLLTDAANTAMLTNINSKVLSVIKDFSLGTPQQKRVRNLVLSLVGVHLVGLGILLWYNPFPIEKETDSPKPVPTNTIKASTNNAPDHVQKVEFNNTKGGIDLNPAQMDVQVNKGGEDFKFNFNGTPIDAAQVTGATFTIRQMTPVTSLPQILG